MPKSSTDPPVSSGRRGSSPRTDRVEALPSPAPPGCRRRAGSRPASSPPESGRPREPQSRRSLHRAQHLRQRRHVGSWSDAHHDCTEHDLDYPASDRAGRRGIRTGRSALHQHRRESHAICVVALSPGGAPLRITTPAEQLLRRQPMAARHTRHVIAALVALGKNPRLVLRRPCPPSAGARKHLKPTNRLSLRFVQKLSVRHVPNPLSTQRRQTIDHPPPRGRCGLNPAYDVIRGERDRRASEFRARRDPCRAASPNPKIRD
jgi:hypothetical protein